MKKKALCIFMLIFWMVGACTLLSAKIEEQMIPQVTTLELDYRDPKLPLDCLQIDEMGPHLYSIYEGTGWEAGTRVKEEESGSYFPTEEGIQLSNSWGTYVQYTSKPLEPGELVENIRSSDKEPDYWLAVFPEGVPEFPQLAEGVVIEEKSDTAVLFSVEKAQQPYMDGRAKSVIPELYGASVYSFSEMRKFLATLPQIGLVFAIVAAAVTLWVCCCFMAKEPKKNRVGLAINIALGLLLLLGLHFALQAVDLPSSMLPPNKITNFGYFFQEYDQFFSTLKSFAPPAAAVGELKPNLPETLAAQEIIHTKNAIIMRPLLFLACGVIFPVALRFLQWAVQYKRSLPKIK